MAEIPRRAVVSATQPAGSSEIVMIVSGCSATQWKKVSPGPNLTLALGLAFGLALALALAHTLTLTLTTDPDPTLEP